MAPTIELKDEVEGELVETSDFFFDRIGEPVPVRPTGGGGGGGGPELYDPGRLPSQPLAVSERFRLVFVAHASGFCVARTGDVVEAAKEMKEKGSRSSVLELSVVDVPLGSVGLLSLSPDSSTLAASVGGTVNFFSVDSLLNKEQLPFFSCSIDEESSVKDMKWLKKRQNSFILLTSRGNLYLGSIDGPLKSLMDNVDAVDCSAKDDYIAVARNDKLSTLSSILNEELHIALSLQPWTGNSDDFSVKVDSLRWVRPDCIILGCFQLTSDGMEESYLLQVIRTRDGEFFHASSEAVLQSFCDVFPGIVDDIIPAGCGPHLFFRYLEQCKLAIAANRKNVDQHIVLFSWSLGEERNEAVLVDINRDNWLPRIELQENGDDNSILGLCTDKVSMHEKVKVQLGVEEQKDLSPFCILFCLSLEGKLTMFNVACIAEQTDFPGTGWPSDVEEDISRVEAQEVSSTVSSGLGEMISQQVFTGHQIQDINTIEHNLPKDREIAVKADTKSSESATARLVTNQTERKGAVTGKWNLNSFAQPQGSNVIEKALDEKHSVGSVSTQSLFSRPQSTLLGQSTLKFPPPKEIQITESKEDYKQVGVGSSPSFVEKFRVDSSSTAQMMQNDVQAGQKVPAETASHGFQISPSQTWLSGKVTSSNSFESRSAFTSNQFEDNKFQTSFGVASANVPSTPFGNPISKGAAPPTSVNLSGVPVKGGGQRVSKEVGIIEPVPSIRSSQLVQENSALGLPSSHHLYPSTENIKSLSQTGMSKKDPITSKQSGNIKEMVNELDTLLDSIVRKGGFKDACTISLKGPVEEIEERIGNLSSQCMMWKSIVEEQLEEVQSLLDNTVQVLARKMYVEGIVKQAKDDQYWDLWNRQKLGTELEMKRQHILKLNQDLTNELIKLERHFNTLELNKFGDISEAHGGRRALQNRYEPPRSVQSLKSLYNTMTSQIMAAEQLSDSLSRQMSVLSIESPSVKQNIKKELFDEIGISYDASFCSPDVTKVSESPGDKKITLSNTVATKDHSRRNQTSALKPSEPETARRRRDSLDQSWASYEPSKTTVKRILSREYQKDCTKSSLLMDEPYLSSSERSGVAKSNHTTPSTYTRQARVNTMYEISGEKASKSPSSPFRQVDGTSGSMVPVAQKSSTSPSSPFRQVDGTSGSMVPVAQKSSTLSYSLSASQASLIDGQTKPRSMSSSNDNLAADKYTGETVNKSKSVFGDQIKPTMVGDTNIHQMPAISIKSPMRTLDNSSETFSLTIKETVLAEPTSGNVKHGSQITESSLLGSQRSENPLLAATPSAPLANSHPEKVPDEHPVIGKSFPSGSLSFSTPFKSMSSPLGSVANSFSIQPSTLSNVPSIKGSSLSEVSSDGSRIISRATTEVNKALPLNFPSSTSSWSVTSPPPSTSLSTTTSYSVQAYKNSVPSLASSLPLEKRSENQKPEIQQEPKVSFGAPLEAPPLLTESFTGGSAVKIEASVSSTPSELSPGLIPGVQGVGNQMGSPQMTETPNAPPEQPLAGKFLFPTSPINTVQKIESLDVTATQEDEMEEVAPETNEKPDLGLGSLNAFGLGSTPSSTTPKGNPFGVSFGSAATTPTSSPFAMAAPGAEMFRPASFSFQSPQSSQPSQPPIASAFSGGFGSPTNAQVPTQSGFGQPSQIGPGQPALGSVLGTFGQSRQIGSGLGGPGFASSSSVGGGFAAASSTGGFSSSATAGGFAGVGSTGGGFAALASSAGGFGGVASGGGRLAGAASAGGGFGGFAAAAPSGARFAAAAPSGAGFAAAAPSGVGFAAAAPGGGFSTGAGFGAFSSQQGAGGFSAFGGGGNTKPPEFLTQMRK
ncbi:nuclear pore complex protein NUP214 isoform X2 [Eucalyptus grandis]|uniref:nuclear pore complex protein NUP214 isoform X2 n=1 Tax=Eucalyptus grandis TaxID=71139 RepID=UPI00192E7991|nr:nuclear pore complex protein NUP214 isoform X2 [Eucalyptus grandis]